MIKDSTYICPLVTVVTVVYNDVDHIEATIQSVLNQNYRNIEYIIIDGKSNDGTCAVVEKYSDRLAHYISEKDNGVYDAMNKAISVATGEWIIFMNSGDCFNNDDSISDVFNNYRDNGEAYVFGNTQLMFDGQKTVMEKPVYKGKQMFMPIQHQSIFARTYEMKAHPFDIQYKIIADYAFFYLLYKRNSKRCYVDTVISCYDMNGLSANNRLKMTKEYLQFFVRNRHFWAINYLVLYIKRLIKK